MRVIIDDTGRVAVPEALREQLGVVPGREPEAIVQGDRLIAEPIKPELELVEENERLVANATRPCTKMTQEDLLRLIDESRTGEPRS